MCGCMCGLFVFNWSIDQPSPLEMMSAVSLLSFLFMILVHVYLFLVLSPMV